MTWGVPMLPSSGSGCDAHTVLMACPAHRGCPYGGKKERRFVTPTETNVHGDALCLMVETWAWARHKTTETTLNNGWRLAVGGWRLVAVGGWWSLGAVLKGCS